MDMVLHDSTLTWYKQVMTGNYSSPTKKRDDLLQDANDDGDGDPSIADEEAGPIADVEDNAGAESDAGERLVEADDLLAGILEDIVSSASDTEATDVEENEPPPSAEPPPPLPPPVAPPPVPGLLAAEEPAARPVVADDDLEWHLRSGGYGVFRLTAREPGPGRMFGGYQARCVYHRYFV